MISPWTKLKSALLGDYRIFRLRRDTSRSPRTGETHDFFVLEAGDWVNIIPLTPEGQVVLIRQFRHGIEEVTLEIPGGMVDGDDGSPLESAGREMLEETGYEAREIVHIGTVTPNPAFLNNRVHSYLALDVERVAEPQLDRSEDIEIELVDMAEIPGLITAGRIHHALVIAAFYFYERYEKRPKRKT